MAEHKFKIPNDIGALAKEVIKGPLRDVIARAVIAQDSSER